MIFAEELGDIFERGKDCYLAHCISSDYALGAGVAVRFREMGVADLLKENYPEVCKNYKPCCLETTAGNKSEDYKGVFNLVTKEKYWQTPTYDSLKDALIDMREQIAAKYAQGEKITVVMPRIGCGLDKLDWNVVDEIITDVFIDAKVILIACKLPENR